jgi:hypothetical protein
MFNSPGADIAHLQTAQAGLYSALQKNISMQTALNTGMVRASDPMASTLLAVDTFGLSQESQGLKTMENLAWQQLKNEQKENQKAIQDLAA